MYGMSVDRQSFGVGSSGNGRGMANCAAGTAVTCWGELTGMMQVWELDNFGAPCTVCRLLPVGKKSIRDKYFLVLAHPCTYIYSSYLERRKYRHKSNPHPSTHSPIIARTAAPATINTVPGTLTSSKAATTLVAT